MKLNKRVLILSVFVLATMLNVQVFAQGGIFDSIGQRNNKGPRQPTNIDADQMKIDIKNNIIELTGNVKVDDNDMIIYCHKMEIYLEDVKADETKKVTKESKSATPGGKKKPKKIICIKDVIIIKKAAPGEDAAIEQRAECGKAIYEVDEGKITLLEKPVLKRNQDELRGEIIEIYRDTNEMHVTSGKVKVKQGLKGKDN